MKEKFYSVRSYWADDIEVTVFVNPFAMRRKTVFSAQGTDAIKSFCDELERKGYQFYSYSEEYMSTSEKPRFLK
jgi:hypothetical protein